MGGQDNRVSPTTGKKNTFLGSRAFRSSPFQTVKVLEEVFERHNVTEIDCELERSATPHQLADFLLVFG